MHRSGTSAVTRVINLLGVPLCRQDDLFQGDGNNTRGYWESRSMMQFNNELLGALGASWRCPPVVVRPSAFRLAKELSVGRSLLSSSHPTRQWAWKDPRNCSLVPFWRAALEFELAAVVVLRHPLEVARSLAATRERIATEESLALWERSLRSVLRDCGGMPVLVTDYSDLISAPPATCSSLADFLADVGAATTLDDRALEGFLDGELRHHTIDDMESAMQELLTNEQSALWHTALELKGPHKRFQPPALPPESPATSGLLERNLPGAGLRLANSWYRTLRRHGLPRLGTGS